MSKNKIARSYATAIYEIARDDSTIDVVLEELRGIKELLDSSNDLLVVMSARQLSVVDKQKILLSVVDKAGAGQLTKRFLNLLVKKNRMDLFGLVVAEYESCVDSARGVLRGMVVTAEPMSKAQIQELERAFTQKFSKTVVLETKEDKAIIGGLLVKIGDLSFDGSLKTALQNIKNSLERQYV